MAFCEGNLMRTDAGVVVLGNGLSEGVRVCVCVCVCVCVWLCV